MHIVFPRSPSGSTSAIIHGLTAEEINEAQRAFDKLGPTARFCIDFVRDPRQLRSYELQRRDALQSLSINDLIQAVRDSRVLRFKVSHPLFLIRRVELKPGDSDEGYLQSYTVESITSHVMEKLKLKLMKLSQEERLRVYETFESVQESRPLAGLVFEAI
jgi:hypothetical protein